MSIALLWDSPHLWGLCAHHALADMGVPHRLLRASSIAQSLGTDKFSLLLVPGGSARGKSGALGEEGREAVRRFVREGGAYLGICGGAGLGLSDEGTGVGLCPWRRGPMADRLQHQLSGNVRLVLGTACGGNADLLPDDLGEAEMPVWWPGRFGEDPGSGDVAVLARYAGFGAGLRVADLDVGALPETVLRDWSEAYGIDLSPSFVGMPCVVAGSYGRGRYVLSYSHLETPASPRANAWFARLLRVLGGTGPRRDAVSGWHPAVGAVWTDPVLLACRETMAELLALGLGQGLLFRRLPWLVGWRAGVPGAGLNDMALALNVLSRRVPGEEARAAWDGVKDAFRAAFDDFVRRAQAYLMAQRLAATLPEAVGAAGLSARRAELFGSPMHGGGRCRTLLDMLDGPLFASLGEE